MFLRFFDAANPSNPANPCFSSIGFVAFGDLSFSCETKFNISDDFLLPRGLLEPVLKNFLRSYFTDFRNKLECLSLESLSSLV